MDEELSKKLDALMRRPVFTRLISDVELPGYNFCPGIFNDGGYWEEGDDLFRIRFKAHNMEQKENK